MLQALRLLNSSNSLKTTQLWEGIYRSVFDACPAGLIVWNADGRIVQWNPKATGIFGWTPEEVQSETSFEFLVPEDLRDSVCEIFNALLEEERPTDSVNRNVTKDGRVITCDWSNIPMARIDGSPTGFVSIVRDVTEELRQSALLAKSEERFRQTFECGSVGTMLVDQSGRFRKVNRALCGMLRYEEAELLELSLDQILAPEAAGKFGPEIVFGVHGQPPTVSEQRFMTKDGALLHVEVALGLIPGERAEETLAVGHVTDITDEVLAHAALMREQAKLEYALQQAKALTAALEAGKRLNYSILASVPSILIGIDADGTVLQWNRAASEFLQISEADALDRPFNQLPFPWESGALEDIVEQCLATGQVVRQDEVRYTHSDGTAGLLGLTANPLFQQPGEPSGVLLLGADRTDRKRLEDQLMQAQKLESIGQLAAGISHEINTPTQFVSDNLRYLDKAFGKVESYLRDLRNSETPMSAEVLQARWSELKLDSVMKNMPDAISEALDGAQRIATIVRAMKEFSHPGQREMSATDLNRCIESTASVARNEWKYVAQLELELDPSLPHVPCLRAELNQVILNMMVNAAHAIAEKSGDSGSMGVIKISTRADDDFAYVTITDTGAGIPEGIQHRVFDPFFTTKEVGKGTGQGLSHAHRVIVKLHGGSIQLSSVPNGGTTFEITLPLKSGIAEAA